MRREVLICLLLAGITLGLYWPVGHFGFIDYDDPDYILANPPVRNGLSLDNAWWAFNNAHAGNWHPLTWLSHALDCQLFGLNPGVFHLENVAWHTANALLVFLGLRKMTRAVWRSALVAALFAWHPAHLESVAWIAERKDVLSGFFFLLTLLAYAFYVQQAESREQKGETGAGFPSSLQPPASSFYLLSLGCFALGLMSKPMLVTLPGVLLLLDYWPLKRISEFGFWSSESRSLRLEKVPFAGLSLLSVLLTLWAQGGGGLIVNTRQLPLLERMANAPVFVALYLEKLFWPANLAIYYPYPHIPFWEQAGGFLLVAGLTVLCRWRWRGNPQPHLLTGWLWFLIMLLPVIGLVKTGGQSIADRYTYLPSIGLFIAVVWGLAAILGRSQNPQGEASLKNARPHPHQSIFPGEPSPGLRPPASAPAGEGSGPLPQGEGKTVAASGEIRSRLWLAGVTAGAAAVLLACLLDTRWQMKYWRNTIVLNRHALAVSPENNVTSWVGLGCALWTDAGDLEGAARSFETALQAGSEDVWQIKSGPIRFRLGCVLLRQDEPAKAESVIRTALSEKPNQVDSAYLRKYLGDALAGQGRAGEAENEYALAEGLLPEDAQLRQQIAASRTLAGLRETLQREPTAEIYVQMAGIEASQGLDRDALKHYLAALQRQPEAPEILNDLAWLLATSLDHKVRDGSRAVQSARRACELTQYGKAVFIGTLAAAYAEAGKFAEAVATAQQACQVAAKTGDAGLLQKNQELLKLYRAHQTARV